MANMYNRGKADIGDQWDWGSGAFKVMLVTTTYTYDPDHKVRDDITNEITNGGYASGGNSLAGMSVAEDDSNDQAEYDADDTTFTSLAAGDQPFAAVVYEVVGSSATDRLICYNALTTPPAPDGNNYKIVWDAEGVFKITDS